MKKIAMLDAVYAIPASLKVVIDVPEDATAEEIDRCFPWRLIPIADDDWLVYGYEEGEMSSFALGCVGDSDADDEPANIPVIRFTRKGGVLSVEQDQSSKAPD